MIPISLSRKITVFQRIGTQTRAAARRSITTQARRKQNRATYEQHRNQLAKIKRIKRECDQVHADYMENKRIIYGLPDTPLARYLLSNFKPLQTNSGRTVWLQLYAPIRHYPAEIYTEAIARTLWI